MVHYLHIRCTRLALPHTLVQRALHLPDEWTSHTPCTFGARRRKDLVSQVRSTPQPHPQDAAFSPTQLHQLRGLFDEFERRMDKKMDIRFAKIERRLDALEERITILEEKFTVFEERFSAFEKKTEERFNACLTTAQFDAYMFRYDTVMLKYANDVQATLDRIETTLLIHDKQIKELQKVTGIGVHDKGKGYGA